MKGKSKVREGEREGGREGGRAGTYLEAPLEGLFGQGDEGRDVSRVDVVNALQRHLHLGRERERGREGGREGGRG